MNHTLETTKDRNQTMAKSILKSEKKPSRSVEALDLCWGDIEIYTFPVSGKWIEIPRAKSNRSQLIDNFLH